MLLEAINSRHDPVEDIDFEYCDNPAKALTFKILTGPFKDILYMYEFVALHGLEPPEKIEDDYEIGSEDHTIRLQFDYYIFENPNEVYTRQEPEFEMLMGDILSKVLLDATSNPETKYDMFVKNEEGKILNLKPADIKKSPKGKSLFRRFMWWAFKS